MGRALEGGTKGQWDIGVEKGIKRRKDKRALGVENGIRRRRGKMAMGNSSRKRN